MNGFLLNAVLVMGAFSFAAGGVLLGVVCVRIVLRECLFLVSGLASPPSKTPWEESWEGMANEIIDLHARLLDPPAPPQSPYPTETQERWHG